MSSEKRFLTTIIEHPEEDEPRLIYANWLEKRGDPRGEFIRLQCQLANMVGEDPLWIDIEERAKSLLQSYEKIWMGSLVEWGDYEFNRGFIESIRIGLGAFIEHSDHLFNHFPIRKLVLIQSTNEEDESLIEQLANSPHLIRITDLDLSSIYLGPSGLQTLLASPYLAHLENLKISDEDSTVSTADALSRATCLQRLTSLKFDGFISSKLGDTGLKLIAEAPHFKTLKLLYLRNNNIKEFGAISVANSRYLRHLEILDLGGGNHTLNFIGVNGALALSSSENSTHLTYLNLDFNGIEDKGLTAIAHSEFFKNLQQLSLQDNDIGDQGILALANSSRIPKLTSLDLSNNRVTDLGLESFVTSQVMTQITQLVLYQNKITSSGIQELAASPAISQLEELNLIQNNIDDPGGEALLNSPYLKNITKLNLDQNPIGERFRSQLQQHFGDRVTF